MPGSQEKRQSKAKTIERLYELFGQHKQIIMATFTNVGSNQLQQIRKLLRSYDGTLMISKNTLIKKVIQMRIKGIEQDEFKHFEAQYGGLMPELEILVPVLKSKVALIFTDSPAFELKTQMEANKVPTEARVGSIAPVDFTVPAGATGLDPSQISFFHALNISTKIVKGQIQITKDFKVATIGKKIKASQAALLKKLNFKPFFYGVKITKVYSDGSILPEQVLNIDPASLLDKFQLGINNIMGLSMATNYPIKATVPLIIRNSFKNIAALSIESGFKMKELDLFGASSKDEDNKSKKTQVPKKEQVVEKPKVVEKQVPKEQPKEEEEQVGMAGLFD